MFATVFIGLICVILGYYSKYPRYRIFFPIAFIIITIFLSMRYMWGNDMSNYVSMYNGIIGRNSTNVQELADMYRKGKEHGWILINLLCKPIGFWGMQTVLNVFETAIIYRFVKRYVSPRWYWLVLFIYCFTTSLMVLSASMLRQYLAMCLFLCALQYLFDKKLLKYILCILLASTIHSSALILLPLYFITYIDVKINIKYLPLLIIFIICWYFIAPKVLSGYISDFLELDEFSSYQYYIQAGEGGDLSSLGLGFLFNASITLLILCSTSYINSKELRLIAFLAVIPFFIIPVSTINSIIGRISQYFYALSAVAIPSLLQTNLLKKPYKILFICLFILFTIYNFYLFFHSPIWYKSYYHYHTILFNRY